MTKCLLFAMQNSGSWCTDTNKVTCDFSKCRSKDCNLLETPTANTGWGQEEPKSLTCAHQAKTTHVKHAACCKP